MQIEKYEVHLEDEIPRIGCGRRRLEVEVGRDWVYIHQQFADRRIRFSRAKFFALAPKRLEA